MTKKKVIEIDEIFEFGFNKLEWEWTDCEIFFLLTCTLNSGKYLLKKNM